MVDAFERRESLRRYANVKLTPPTGPTVGTKGIVSLRGIFFEGSDALPSAWGGALVGVEADLGGPNGPLRAVCLVTPPNERPRGGHLLTWKTLDFEAERELARYLDEKK